MVFTLYRRHDTSSGTHPGILIEEGRGVGCSRGMSSRPTHNHPPTPTSYVVTNPLLLPPPHPHPPTVSPTVVSPAQYQVPASLTYLQQVSQTYFTYLSQSGSLKQKIGWHLPGLLKCAWWNSSYVKLRKQNASWLNSCLSSKPEENVSH